MAITDNQFTAEEVRAAVSANPSLSQVIADYAQQNETIRKTIEQSAIDRKTSEFAQKLEENVKKFTGVEKSSPDEKYYDYMERAVGVLKTQIEEAKKSDKTDGAKQKEIEDLQKRITELTNASTEKEKELQGQIREMKIKHAVAPVLAQLESQIMDTLPESVKKSQLAIAEAEMMKNADLTEDGTVIFKDENGVIIKDSKEHKPVGAEVIARTLMKDILTEEKKQDGAGSGRREPKLPGGDNPPGNGGKEGWVDYTPGVNVKTRVGLYEDMKKHGIVEGNDQWNAIFEEHKELPLQ